MGAGKSKKVTTSFAILLTLVFSLMAGVVAQAQVTGATLAGTVSDSSGGVVTGATVSSRNIATGLVRESTTDSAGLYTIPNLVPGDYEVKVSAAGFSTAVQSNLSLAVGQQQQLNFSMKVGATNTTVQVTEAAPQIELTSSALSGQVESETVRELPLNGRDWTQLATLQPGVKRIETQMAAATSARGNRGFGGELTVSGQRSTFNNYRIDGISVVDYANAAPGNVAGLVLGVDAIEEFSVLTGGFPAEYGRATGGVVNAISKSGTNSLHGTAYDFLRNSAFDSRDFATRVSGGTRPAFRQNQFGVSAGAPIIKDKTFVFGDYEGLRRTKGIVTPTTTFSNNARLGILSGCAGGTGTYPNCSLSAACPADTAQLDPNASICVNNYAKALLPLWPVSTVGVSGDTAQLALAGSQVLPENFYTVRVDHKLGNNDTLFGTYLFDDTDYTQPDGFLDVNTDSHTRRQTIAIEENHTFSSNFVNTVRVGYNRDRVVNLFTPTAINPAAGMTSLGFITGQYPARMSVGVVTDFFGGINAGSHYLHTWNSYQYSDDAFWTHGAHTIKFGVSVEQIRYNEHTYQSPGGRIKFAGDSTGAFAGPQGFLQGLPTYYEASLPAVDFPRAFRQTNLGFYVQDDWKLKSNLTVNVGVRYEPSTVLKDGQGRITSLANITDSFPVCGVKFTDPIPSAPAQPGSTCSSVGPYYSNATLRNFAPRLGFVWDPFKNGKSSVRGSVGLYDVNPIPGYFLLQQNQAAPFTVFSNNSGTPFLATQPGFNSAFAPGEGGVDLVSGKAVLAASTVESKPKRSYVSEWNLTLQRQLTSDMSLTVGYVGSRGVHLMTRGDDGNMAGAPGSPAVYAKTPYGYLFPCGFPTQSVPTNGAVSCTPGTFGGVNGTATTAPGGGLSAQLNPNLGVIRYIYWNANANYHALNINLDKKFTHGFQFQVAYTFSKSLDDTSQTIAGDTFGNGINSPMPFLANAFYGPSDYNVAHTLSINGLYDIPTPKSWSGALNQALGGWELGGIVTWNSGAPTTAIVSGDPLGLGNNGADQFGPLVKVPGCTATDSSKAGYAGYINANCFTFPSVPTSAIGSLPYGCASFAAVPNTATTSYCANLVPFNVGRNSITGPHFFNTDFSVLKNFPITRISEAFKVQFRAEMFNITNHSNFVPGQPDSGNSGSTLYKTSGALIASRASKFSTAASEPREVQFALKLVW